MSTDDSTISYDYTKCEGIYENLLNDQGTIGAQIASLESIITSLMNTWTGLSANQWQSIQSRWMTAIGNMTSDLNKAAHALPEMAAAMKHADNAAAVRIASIGR